MSSTSPIASVVADLIEEINYPETGVRNQLLFKDDRTHHSLMCLAKGTTIAEHTSPRTVALAIVEGQGTLTLEGREIALKPGVFIVMPAHAPHALQTTNTNLVFLHSKW